MKIPSSRSFSFAQPLSGMLKPFHYLYFAGFKEREKLLDVLEAYSLRPAMFEQKQSALIMPIPATEDFSEFRFCGMFRNLILLPDTESRLDLLAIRNLPRCFHQPELQFRSIIQHIPEEFRGKLLGLRRFYGQPDGPESADFYGSLWMPDEIFEDNASLENPSLQDLQTKRREFRLRLCCFRNYFRFELREQQGDAWQSDPELYFSSHESHILLFLILTARNTGTPLSELMSLHSFEEARVSFREAWQSIGKLLKPAGQKLYRKRSFDGRMENEEEAAFVRVMRIIESTGFTAGSKRDRVPVILDDTALNHPDFSLNRWNLLIGHFTEWVYPDKGIEIPASG
jgi:hypothetical protein